MVLLTISEDSTLVSTTLTLVSTPSRSSFRWVLAKILLSKLRLEPLTLQDLGLTLLT